MVREERGQTAAEYLGVLLIVALIISAIVTSGVPGAVVDGVSGAVCRIAQQPGGEEVALGSDARRADTDGDGTPDGEEFAQGTDPTQGIAPLTRENVLTPWV